MADVVGVTVSGNLLTTRDEYQWYPSFSELPDNVKADMLATLKLPSSLQVSRVRDNSHIMWGYCLAPARNQISYSHSVYVDLDTLFENCVNHKASRTRDFEEAFLWEAFLRANAVAIHNTASFGSLYHLSADAWGWIEVIEVDSLYSSDSQDAFRLLCNYIVKTRPSSRETKKAKSLREIRLTAGFLDQELQDIFFNKRGDFLSAVRELAKTISVSAAKLIFAIRDGQTNVRLMLDPLAFSKNIYRELIARTARKKSRKPQQRCSIAKLREWQQS
ncbi:hypothetical protein BU16DRAFT_554181 [Lophium mytilinum]|uniref:Uncharacterized protein n=1 Tax=Lophium mytilinum TaxID=390894 RepID=A0A6A6RC19_9PEZI|nr:hypothetical protein BU16DRAFT_554181 [Lophium mytilinum]